MTYKEYSNITAEQAYTLVRSGEWTMEVFVKWYAVKLLEAQDEAVYYQNLCW